MSAQVVLRCLDRQPMEVMRCDRQHYRALRNGEIEGKSRSYWYASKPFSISIALRSFFYGDDVRLNLAIDVVRSEPSGDKGGRRVSRFAQ